MEGATLQPSLSGGFQPAAYVPGKEWVLQAGEVRKEVPRIAARGQAVKKGLQGMKGGKEWR